MFLTKLDKTTSLEDFEKMTVSVRTTVAPKHTYGLRMSRDKGFKGASFEHFSLCYFRDSEVTYCIQNQSSALVVVSLRPSKPDDRLKDLDLYFMSLINNIKQKLKCRKIKHISVNILISGVPDNKCEFKFIKINGFYRKAKDARRIRMDVIAFDHADEVAEYYDNVATSGSTNVMSDPTGFESYLEKSDRSGYNNINQWLLANHLSDINTRRRMIEDAKELLSSNNSTKAK